MVLVQGGNENATRNTYPAPEPALRIYEPGGRRSGRVFPRFRRPKRPEMPQKSTSAKPHPPEPPDYFYSHRMSRDNLNNRIYLTSLSRD